jgi:hypothetical protein
MSPIFEAMVDFEVEDEDGTLREIRRGSWWRTPGADDEFIIRQAPSNFAIVYENAEERNRDEED